jgi:hypothetical protein
VANTQWLDKSHPQTLLSANMLLYFFAGLWILEVLLGVGIPFFGLLAIPAIFAGLGIRDQPDIRGCPGCAVAAPDEPELRAHLVQANEGARPEAPALAVQPVTGSAGNWLSG